jgi:hypothetical protein
MFANIKHGIHAALTAYFVIAVLAYVLTGTAHAQTITYVRPSKGQVIDAARIQQNTATTTSALFDWTAFSSATTSVKFLNATGGACACPAGNKCTLEIIYKIVGSTAKTGPFSEIDGIGATVPVFGNTAEDGFEIGTTNISLPYIKLTAETGPFTNVTLGAPIATACFVTFTLTPNAFTYRTRVEGLAGARTLLRANASPVVIGGSDYQIDGFQNVVPYMARVNEDGMLAVGFGAGSPTLPLLANGGGPLTVAASPAAATKVFDFGPPFSALSGLRIENVGTNFVVCAAGKDSNQVSLTNYSFALKAATATNNGTGGVIEIPQFATRFGTDDSKRRVYCVAAAAGSSTVVTMPY